MNNQIPQNVLWDFKWIIVHFVVSCNLKILKVKFKEKNENIKQKQDLKCRYYFIQVIQNVQDYKHVIKVIKEWIKKF